MIPTDRIADLELAYYRRLRERADEWRERHGAESAEIEAQVRQRFGFPDGELKGWQAVAVKEHAAELVRERAGWPTLDVWVAQQRLAEIDSREASDALQKSAGI